MQNPSGAFASYELIRGPFWVEKLNPAEVFGKLNASRMFKWRHSCFFAGNIMIEWPYPECTTSSITALALFRKRYPDYRSADIEYAIPSILTFLCWLTVLNRRCIQNAVKYIHDAQFPHGGWVGSWGICFTYATQFALESLSLVGETYATSERARRACEFLISHQRPDGGWGESYKVRSKIFLATYEGLF
jgi:lanosterol synthase